MFDWRMWAGIGTPVFLVMVSVGIWALVIHLGRRSVRHRITPLTADLLRPPGHGLREDADDLTNEIELNTTLMLVIPLLLYAMIVGDAFWRPNQMEWWVVVGLSLGGLGLMVWLVRKTVPLWRRRRYVLHGLDGERAVAEELNQLMLGGARVFHDVPIGYGNIDHVVVTHSGVYAVETKMRGKLSEGTNSVAVVVDHEKGELRFPDRREGLRKIEAQMETQARCLSDWLSSSTGQKVEVESILALPGWKVERIGRGPVFVINPKRPHAFFLRSFDKYTLQQIQAIAHQLEQRCRNVEPIAVREPER